MKRVMIAAVASLASSLVFAAGFVFADGGVDPAEILKPLRDQWTTYSGDYTGKRYSSLKQINESTVKNLSFGWVTRFAAGCGPTGTGAGGEGGFDGARLGRRGGGGTSAPII